MRDSRCLYPFTLEFVGSTHRKSRSECYYVACPLFDVPLSWFAIDRCLREVASLEESDRRRRITRLAELQTPIMGSADDIHLRKICQREIRWEWMGQFGKLSPA